MSQLSREQILAQAALVQFQVLQGDDTTLAKIIAAGEDEYVRLARTAVAGWGFRTDDFRAIFRLLVLHARQQIRQMTEATPQ